MIRFSRVFQSIISRQTAVFVTLPKNSTYYVMAETPNTYLTCYIKNGKVIEQLFLKPDEVRTMEAVGRSKGYETETFVIDLSKKVEKVESDITPTGQCQAKKRTWNKWIRCVETGQVFPTVRECSKQMGIPYTTIINCVKKGNATRGYHFVLESNRFESFRNIQNHNKNKSKVPSKKIMCITNGERYDSVKDCLRACSLSVSSLYRALQKGTLAKGLLFKYLDTK